MQGGDVEMFLPRWQRLAQRSGPTVPQQVRSGKYVQCVCVSVVPALPQRAAARPTPVLPKQVKHTVCACVFCV
jgi:hypothetical protein